MSAQTIQRPQIPPPASFGSWTKLCSIPPGTPNIMCELVQTVSAKERPDISFRIAFIKVPQSNETLLRVIVPIRVELQLGVGIKFDNNKDAGTMPYRRCLNETCVAEAMLSREVMHNFIDGKTATFFVFPTPEEGVGAIIDLNGIKAAYAALP